MKKFLLVFSLCLLIYSCKTTKMKSDDRNYLIQQIDQIYQEDQKYAGIPPTELTKKYRHKEARVIFNKTKDSVKLLHQDKINLIYERFGYLGYDKVGIESSDKFYISIQHADNNVDFQKKMLKALKIEVDNKNASKSNYALLNDRIKINEGKKQDFGTQVTYRKNGQAFPKNGLADSLNVDQFRKEYNLGPLKNYLNDLTISHFEMNKSIYEKMKIYEPQLYQ